MFFYENYNAYVWFVLIVYRKKRKIMADLDHKKKETEEGKESSGSHILSSDMLELPLQIGKKVVSALVKNDESESEIVNDSVSETSTAMEETIGERVGDVVDGAVRIAGEVAEALGDIISDTISDVDLDI